MIEAVVAGAIVMLCGSASVLVLGMAAHIWFDTYRDYRYWKHGR